MLEGPLEANSLIYGVLVVLVLQNQGGAWSAIDGVSYQLESVRLSLCLQRHYWDRALENTLLQGNCPSTL